MNSSDSNSADGPKGSTQLSGPSLNPQINFPKQLIDLRDMSAEQIVMLWKKTDLLLASSENAKSTVPASVSEQKRIAWSFEGNGIRTRTTFIQAFQQLGHSFVELPNLLKTAEPVQDLAGYLDHYYDLYIIRDSQHARLKAFSQATVKPVINAMSSGAHPCEILSDGYSLYKHFPFNSTDNHFNDLKILLWGPMTNVLRSWHDLASLFKIDVTHYSPDAPEESLLTPIADRMTTKMPQKSFDLVVTDGWPPGFSDPNFSLTMQHLNNFGSPMLLPTPPFTVGEEVAFHCSEYKGFSGYSQKNYLLPVQTALIQSMLQTADQPSDSHVY